MTVAENLRKKSYRRSKSHFQAYFVTRFQYENNRYDSKLQFDNVDQLLLGCRYLFFFLNNCVKLRWRGHKCEHSLSIIYVTLCQHYDYFVTCENHNFHPEIENKSENKVIDDFKTEIQCISIMQEQVQECEESDGKRNTL